MPFSLNKTRGRGLLLSLNSVFNTMARLEFELQTKPHVEWQIVYRVQLTGITGRLTEVRVRLTKRAFSELIDQADFLIVRYVEEVTDESQFRAFSDFERVVAMQIQATIKRRPAKLAASAERHFTWVRIDRMRIEIAERNA